MQKDEEMEEQTSLPIKYEKTVDKEGCVTIPYWINIFSGKKYLFNIYNKNSGISYSNLEKEIRIRRGNKGKYFLVGTKSEIFRAGDILDITILEQIYEDLSVIYSSEILDEEKDKFFPTRFCRIIFLYSIENQKIVHSYEDKDTLSQTHPDLLDLEYIKDSFQILEENGGELPKDDHIIYNAQRYDHLVVVRFLGTKRGISRSDILELKKPKEEMQILYQTFVPYCFLIITKTQYLGYILAPTITRNIDFFLRDYVGVSAYTQEKIKEITNKIQTQISELFSMFRTEFKKKSSLYNIKFQYSIPPEYVVITETIQKMLVFNIEKISVDELKSEIAKKNNVDDEIIMEAIEWLKKHLVIKIRYEEEKRMIYGN